MKSKNSLLIFGAILLGIFVLFYQLFKSGTAPEISLVELPDQKIYGVWFEGRQVSPEMRHLFETMDSLAAQSDEIHSAALFYDNPIETESRDSVRAFIGLFGPEAIEGFEMVELEKGSWLRMKIVTKGFQIPYKVYELLDDYAHENKLEIGDLSVERYFGDSLMIIDQVIVP